MQGPNGPMLGTGGPAPTPGMAMSYVAENSEEEDDGEVGRQRQQQLHAEGISCIARRALLAC